MAPGTFVDVQSGEASTGSQPFSVQLQQDGCLSAEQVDQFHRDGTFFERNDPA